MGAFWSRITAIFRPLPDKSLHDELRRQQYEALKSKVVIMYAVVLIQLAAWMMGGIKGLPALFSFYLPAALMVMIATRVLVWMRRRNDEPDAASIRRRIRATILLAWGISLLMGVYGASILAITQPGQFGFALLFICLAAIAGAYCLSVLPAAALPTVVVGALPSALLLLASGHRLTMAIGIDLILTCLIVLGIAAAQYREFVDNLVAQAREKRLAQSDALTGLPNRRAFMDHLRAMAAADREGASFALLMIDLNGFKPINDNYGHSLGDEVLVQVAQRLRRVGAARGFTARLGGDEFAIIAPGIATAADARDHARRIQEIFGRPFSVEGVTVSLSAVIGFALFPQDADDEDTLICNADLALYRGKKGGGPIVHYDGDFKMQTRRAMQLEQALNIMDGISEVEIVYQPIVDLASGETLRFEALARWNESSLGEINPLEFIGAAERTGKISRMSEHLLGTALLAASSWPPHIGLSINMSAAQLHSPSIPLMVARLLDFYQFHPPRLEIELTEAAFLKDMETARLTVGLMRDMGVRIVLDNFGAGQASIGYLREISFDHVKIDGNLLRDIEASAPAQLLVAGVLQLCGAMGVGCTAEMVEREAQRDIVRRLGCERAQGYLFGRPISGEDVARRLAPLDARRQYSALLAFGEAQKAV